MLRIPLRGECVVSLDLATAALTHTGNSGITPAGLGEIGSTLFTAADEGTGLYRVNTLTGDLTEISSLGLNGAGFNTLGSTTTGLYALDNSFNLFRINPTTGVATFLGAPGAYRHRVWELRFQSFDRLVCTVLRRRFRFVLPKHDYRQRNAHRSIWRARDWVQQSGIRERNALRCRVVKHTPI